MNYEPVSVSPHRLPRFMHHASRTTFYILHFAVYGRRSFARDRWSLVGSRWSVVAARSSLILVDHRWGTIYRARTLSGRRSSLLVAAGRRRSSLLIVGARYIV